MQCQQTNSKINNFHPHPQPLIYSYQPFSPDVKNSDTSTLYTKPVQTDNPPPDQVSATQLPLPQSDHHPITSLGDKSVLFGGTSHLPLDTSNHTEVPILQRSPQEFPYHNFFADHAVAAQLPVRILTAHQAPLLTHDSMNQQTLQDIRFQTSPQISMIQKNQNNDMRNFLLDKAQMPQDLMNGHGLRGNKLDSVDLGLNTFSNYLTPTVNSYISKQLESLEHPQIDLRLNKDGSYLFNDNIPNQENHFRTSKPPHGKLDLEMEIQKSLQQLGPYENLAEMEKQFDQRGSPLVNDKTMNISEVIYKISQTPSLLDLSYPAKNSMKMDPYKNQHHERLQSKTKSDKLISVHQKVSADDYLTNNVPLQLNEPWGKQWQVDTLHTCEIVTAMNKIDTTIITRNNNTNEMTNKELNSNGYLISETNNAEVIHPNVNAIDKEEPPQYLRTTDQSMESTDDNVYGKIRTLIGLIGNGTSKLVQRFDQILRSKEFFQMNKRTNENSRKDQFIGAEDNVEITAFNELGKPKTNDFEILPSNFFPPIAKKGQIISNAKKKFKKPMQRDTSLNQPVEEIQVQSVGMMPSKVPGNIFSHQCLAEAEHKGKL